MTSLLLLSHSQRLAEGLKELLEQVAPSVIIETSGGTADGELGSNFEEIYEKMNRLAKVGNVAVLFDIGSSMLNAVTALDMMDEEETGKISLFDCPMIESGMEIAVMAECGENFEKIKEYASSTSLRKLG